MQSIEQLKQHYNDTLDKAVAIRAELRARFTEELAALDGFEVDPPPKPTAKPPSNGKPGRGRKAKPSTPKKRRPKIAATKVDEAVLDLLSEQDGVTRQQLEAASKEPNALLELTDQQIGASLNRLVDAGRVSREGKKNAKWYLQAASETTSASDEDDATIDATDEFLGAV